MPEPKPDTITLCGILFHRADFGWYARGCGGDLCIELRRRRTDDGTRWACVLRGKGPTLVAGYFPKKVLAVRAVIPVIAHALQACAAAHNN